ncbi:MAG TPA: hypothetical protein VKU60_18925, partial [Chloroflexota bacterium]|nr:hypothetical protein [Chloroflexota bacterium]
DPTRRLPHRDGGGSVAKPLSGNVTVHIFGKDANGNACPGYCPSTVYVTPGTTVTWINDDPNDIHQVRQRSSNATNPDTIHPLDSNGLGTGQSYAYTFNYANNAYCTNGGGVLNPSAFLTNSAGNTCGGLVSFSNKYESQTADDTIFASTSGQDGGTQRKMIGNVKLVVKCSSIGGDGRCMA